MKVVIASDSFKDALPAIAVCQAIEKGLRLSKPDVNIVLFPLADGGEGTSEILTFHAKGKSCRLQVHDPLFRPIQAQYGLSGDGSTAFIEMAAASGLQLLRAAERNPMRTTSLGTGELILDAMKRGVKRIILGIGGSSTNDMGVGMAMALGFRFLDKAGQPITPIGGNLGAITQIDYASLPFDLSQYQIEVICDVDNPLFGVQGAAYVYGAQKGANQKEILQLDEGMRNLAVLLEETYGQNFALLAGAGAAGGMGAGTMAFLGAKLRPGIEMVMELTQFEQHLLDADLVITGEGRLDAQTLHGKLIYGIANKAKQYKVPVVAVCGSLNVNPDQFSSIGLQAAFSISTGPSSLEEAIGKTKEGLENMAFNIMQLFSGQS